MSTFDTAYHAPVLTAEVVELLGNAKTVLDGTLGGGGHSEALLEAGVSSVTGVDRDADAVATARERLARFESAGRFTAVLSNYAAIDETPRLRDARFDGVLLDLGVSSRQIDEPSRGFTFREGAPLDMRMSHPTAPAAGETAADILNAADERTLATIFREYGDERHATRLAREIARRRAREPFATSDHLVKAIRAALGPRSGPSDFARLFQALRIVVNNELEELRDALPVLRDHLAPGGRFVVITYHSGEDRLVKHAFRDWSVDCVCPPKQPVCTCGGRSLGELVARRAIVPSDEEIARNPRSRSAKLRAWRKHWEDGIGESR